MVDDDDDEKNYGLYDVHCPTILTFVIVKGAASRQASWTQSVELVRLLVGLLRWQGTQEIVPDAVHNFGLKNKCVSFVHHY